MSQFVTIGYPGAKALLLAFGSCMRRKGDHEPDQSGFDVERGSAGRDGERAGTGLAQRASALRRRHRRSVLSVVLPPLLSLLLSPGRRGACCTADVCRTGRCAALTGRLVLLRGIQDLLSLRQGMPRRLAARGAAAGTRRLS